MRKNVKKVWYELKEHAPFTALATGGAVFIVLFIHYSLKLTVSEDIFHLFHFSHIIVSAMVTAGLFYKYRKSLPTAILIGVLGAVLIGSLSDVIFPFLASTILGLEIHFHLPLIEESFFVLSFALLGASIGVATMVTKSPHFIHVFLSVFASLFYLMVFSSVFTLGYFLIAFFIVFIAVVIPCCLSDIVFPFLFIPSKKDR